jgi:nicotinamide-nucleotide amidase
MKKFYLICIGSEILQGKIQDKNTLYLAKFLYEHGHKLIGSLIVDDSDESILSALSEVKDKSDYVILCGGMGPTLDDITKDCVARYFAKEKKEDLKALAIIQKQYERMNRDYPLTHAYHIIPQDFEALYNPVGYAPGLRYQNYFLFPGVPSEFQGMVQTYLTMKSGHDQKLFTAKTFGIAESIIFNSLMPNLWERLLGWGTPSSLPHGVGVDIGVLLEGNTSQKEEELISFFNESVLHDHIVAFGHDPIEKHVIEKLKEKKMTLALAESCSGGLIADKLTNIPGSSEFLMGSLVTYNLSAKNLLLGLDQNFFQNNLIVSTQTALEMARAAKNKLNSDIGLGITGIAGPSGDGSSKKIGDFSLAIVTDQKEYVTNHNLKGTRLELKEKFSSFALYELQKLLNSL